MLGVCGSVDVVGFVGGYALGAVVADGRPRLRLRLKLLLVLVLLGGRPEAITACGELPSLLLELLSVRADKGLEGVAERTQSKVMIRERI